MITTFFNHFVHDTFLNQLLEKKSYLKYTEELHDMKEKYDKLNQHLPSRFIIFNFPRSGSNFLCTMLNNHPDIICHNEIFNPKKIFYSKDFHELYSAGKSISREDLVRGKIGLGSKRERNYSPEKFLMKIWHYNYGNNAVGFNLFPTHVPNMANSLLKDREVKKILLIRQNKIRCYVSRAIARKTNSWSNYSNSSSSRKKSKTTKVYVNANSLLKWSQKYDRYFASLRQTMTDFNQPFIEVKYEDLIDVNSDIHKINLLKFIEVPVKLDKLQPLNKKQNSSDLSEIIINFSELKNKLSGTQLEPLLYC